MQHDFILLDRSGSMSSIWNEAINSVNAYVKKLAEQRVETAVTLAVFDSDAGLNFDIVRNAVVPYVWQNVSPTEVTPRGLTPLNDATGKIVSLAKAGNFDKVAIIIMTDGHENSSKELSVPQAKALLDECRAKNWQVIFLGANFDNASQAMNYGNQFYSTISASALNLTATMETTAGLRAAYATKGTAMMYSDAQKEEAKKG